MRTPIVAVLLGLLSLPGAAGAATFTVTTTANSFDGVCDGDCSVRDAIAAANASPGPDDVAIPAGTYPIQPGLVVTDDVAIAGAGLELTVLDRAGAPLGRAISNTDFSVSIELRDLTVTGAATGGVISDGPLVLERVRVAYNAGRGVRGRSSVLVQDSLIEHNTPAGLPILDLEGGGLAVLGDASVVRTIVRYNHSAGDSGGGGILISGGDSEVVDSQIHHNTAFRGGGLYWSAVSAPDRLSVLRSAIVFNHAVPEIDGELGWEGIGAGIHAGVYGGAEMTLRNSTVGYNTGHEAEGTNESGPFTIGSLGGGIFFSGTGVLRVEFSTIAQNLATSGGGVFTFDPDEVDFEGSIVATNESTAGPDDCDKPQTSLGYNVAGASCGLADPSDSNGPHGLAPIRFDAGTWVYPLYSWSAAADSADTGTCPGDDQRGVARPVDLGGGPICDAGAYEAEMFATPPGPEPVPAVPAAWLLVAGALLAGLVVRRWRSAATTRSGASGSGARDPGSGPGR